MNAPATPADASAVQIRRVLTKADRKSFIALAYRLNADDPNWIPPLKEEVKGLITPGKNPWFEHAEAAFFLALRKGAVVGRISAQVDALVLEHMAPGLGQWGGVQNVLFAAPGASVAGLRTFAEEIMPAFDASMSLAQV